MTLAFNSTAVQRMRIVVWQKRVIAAAPRPSCTAWPCVSSALVRSNIQAIMRWMYSSSSACGLAVRMAPCTHGVPRCR